MPVSQILVNSVLWGSQLGLLALGLTMTYSILRFSNFAHGELSLAGAYLAFFLGVSCGMNFILAALIAVGLSGVLALVTDKLVFKKIREAPVLALIIASLGLSLCLRNIASAIWGHDALSFGDTLAQPYRIFGAYITSTQIIILAVSVAAMISFHFLLHRTKLGKAMRAMSDDRSLAQDRGIEVEKTISWVWFICGCYAGLGGVLIAWETALWPEMGFEIIIPVFCAAILGGIGNVYGAVLGALLIGLVENIGLAIDWAKLVGFFGIADIDHSIYIPTEYKTAISFLILVLVLIFMPTGIMGGRKGH